MDRCDRGDDPASGPADRTGVDLELSPRAVARIDDRVDTARSITGQRARQRRVGRGDERAVRAVAKLELPREVREREAEIGVRQPDEVPRRPIEPGQRPTRLGHEDAVPQLVEERPQELALLDDLRMRPRVQHRCRRERGEDVRDLDVLIVERARRILRVHVERADELIAVDDRYRKDRRQTFGSYERRIAERPARKVDDHVHVRPAIHRARAIHGYALRRGVCLREPVLGHDHERVGGVVAQHEGSGVGCFDSARRLHECTGPRLGVEAAHDGDGRVTELLEAVFRQHRHGPAHWPCHTHLAYVARVRASTGSSATRRMKCRAPAAR